MLNLYSWIVDTIKNDATIQTLMGVTSADDVSIYPSDIDISPENFPAITYTMVSGTILSKPQGMYIGRIQLDIWSSKNALEVENFHERLAELFNFKDSTTQTITDSTLWWVREENIKDMHESKRRVWRKAIDLKFWLTPSALA